MPLSLAARYFPSSEGLLPPAFNGAGSKSTVKFYIRESMISAEMDNGVVNAVKYLVLNVGRSLV